MSFGNVYVPVLEDRHTPFSANAIEEGGEQIAQIFAHVSTRDVTGVYFSEPFTRRIQAINPSRKT